MENLYKVEDDIENFYNLTNGWWYYSVTRNVVIHGNEKVALAKKRRIPMSVNPMLCNVCNFVWTYEIDTSGDNEVSFILEDFPRRGLKKKICHFCR